MPQQSGGANALENRMLTIQEAADYMGMGKRWLERYIHNHPEEIPKFRFGQAVRYRLSDIEALIAKQQVQ